MPDRKLTLEERIGILEQRTADHEKRIDVVELRHQTTWDLLTEYGSRLQELDDRDDEKAQ